ncbi:MAG: type II secretion system protein [Candidatus Omnitrophota bacterium]|nr:type II secretion system protein [Candidatus Omnitrophota bacterium]
MRKKQGITLLQMMISVAMFAVLSSAFTFVFFITLKNWNYQSQRLELREPAIWGLENISQDLRRASSFSVCQASQIEFTISPYETVNYNRVLTSGVWQIVRTYTPTGLSATTATVAKNVSAFTLEFYNSAGTLISTPIGTQAQRDNVRLVRITLSLQSTLLSNVETVTLRTQIRPRNL